MARQPVATSPWFKAGFRLPQELLASLEKLSVFEERCARTLHRYISEMDAKTRRKAGGLGRVGWKIQQRKVVPSNRGDDGFGRRVRDGRCGWVDASARVELLHPPFSLNLFDG